MEINKEKVGDDIKIINQCSTYKLFKNFELNDIDVPINGEIIPIKYKNNNSFGYQDISVDSENSKKMCNELGDNNYSFN